MKNTTTKKIDGKTWSALVPAMVELLRDSRTSQAAVNHITDALMHLARSKDEANTNLDRMLQTLKEAGQ